MLDRVAAVAPRQLRKGPRGGGRDRDAVVRHVAAAEFSYGRKIGVRRAEAADDPAAVAALRQAILDVLGAPSDGTPLTTTGKGWPQRYGAASRGTSSITSGRSRTGSPPTRNPRPAADRSAPAGASARSVPAACFPPRDAGGSSVG